MARMTQTEIISSLADSCGCKKTEVKAIFDALAALATGEVKQHHADQQVQRVVMEQREGEKFPILPGLDARTVQREPAEKEFLPTVLIAQEKLGDHLCAKSPHAERDEQRRRRGTPRRPRSDERLDLAAGGTHTRGS